MSVLYNEIDPFAAAWLRELIATGQIAPGDVCERDIRDISPDELRGYTQCHFFAGIGVWSLALRRAGVRDDEEFWTGSAPCQPFSAAGKGGGFDDERHLWPHFYYLIEQRRPAVVAGEQVASKDGLGWLDLVQADLEGTGYACGAVDTCSAGFGAPHIRQRLYWIAERLADATHQQHDRSRFGGAGRRIEHSDGGATGRVGDDDDAGLEGHRGRHQAAGGWVGAVRPVAAAGQSGGLELAGGERRERREAAAPRHVDDRAAPVGPQGQHGCGVAGASGLHQDGTCPTNGIWRDADWLFCRDGKWRPVESRPQPMVDGSAESLGRLRAGDIEEVEFEVAEWAVGHQAEPGKALHDLRRSLSARAQREWPVGGLPDLHGAPFLLAFLRQLQEQGWAFAERLPGEGAQTSEVDLRVLRDGFEAARASCGRGLDEQHADERADPLCVLSSILARHAQAAWSVAHRTYATTGFPLATGAHARVGRLRGYGNAINAVAAEEFIRAYLEKDVIEIDAERVRLSGVFA